MPKKTSTKYTQRVTPYLLYRDVGKALQFLEKAFDLQEFGDRFEGPDGTIQHAAVKLRGSEEAVMMGCPGPKYKNPKKLGSVTQMLYVNVANVDKHFARAKKAGARILEEPTDTFYGDRRYGAADPEGHQWFFAQTVRHVSAEEMKKALKK